MRPRSHLGVGNVVGSRDPVFLLMSYQDNIASMKVGVLFEKVLTSIARGVSSTVACMETKEATYELIQTLQVNRGKASMKSSTCASDVSQTFRRLSVCFLVKIWRVCLPTFMSSRFLSSGSASPSARSAAEGL